MSKATHSDSIVKIVLTCTCEKCAEMFKNGVFSLDMRKNIWYCVSDKCGLV